MEIELAWHAVAVGHEREMAVFNISNYKQNNLVLTAFKQAKNNLLLLSPDKSSTIFTDRPSQKQFLSFPNQIQDQNSSYAWH